MKYIICVLILYSCTAQSSNFLVPKPFTWNELVELQRNVVDDYDNYAISPQCFSEVKSYNGLKKELTVQNILWKTYVWETYKMPDRLNCILLYENYLTNPSVYKVLSELEAKSLLSASEGFKFSEKGLYEFSNYINKFNQETLKSIKTAKHKNLADYANKNLAKSLDYTTIKFTLSAPQEIGMVVRDEFEKGGFVLGVDHNQTYLYPYSSIALGQSEHAQCGRIGEFSSFLMSSNVTITNAHSIYTSCQFPTFLQQQVAAHLDQNIRLTHFPIMVAANAQIANNYLSFPVNGSLDDYAAIRFNYNHILPYYIGITTDLGFQEGDNIRNIGYPKQSIPSNLGMREDFADYFESDNMRPQVVFDKTPYRVYPGQSGSPSFRNNESAAYGILTLEIENSDGLGIVNGFTPSQLNDILAWLTWNPTGIISFPNAPASGSTYNLVEVPEFLANVTPINNLRIDGSEVNSRSNLDDLIEWTSSIDGNFGNGGTVSQEQLKTSLSDGRHFITAKIDSNGEQAESNVIIDIIKPTGDFTSPDFCIIDLSSSSLNSCALDISWSVTDTPETSVVWNETDDVSFASGNSGSLSYTATTDTTVFKLYPSDEKIILLDTLNVQAKQPTGTLTSVHPNCSLQPSPYDANGNPQDPKANPSGCGTSLEWSNVQWASPGIFYRTGGSGSWQLLHQIPCALDGEICSGSLNTDDFTHQMITTSGVEFKLLQFTDAGSGVLTSSFTVTAHRFADAYEFDDGWYDVPQGAGIDSHQLAAGGTISNSLGLGQVQANHNFHRPAAYDPVVDIDAFDILKGSLPPSGPVSNQVAIEIMNMASGLDVSFEVQCVGFYDDRAGPYDDIEPMYGVWDIPFNRIVSEEFVSSDKKVMKFNYFDGYTGYYNGQFYDYPGCSRNRVLVKYQAGETGENLTYDIRAYDTSQPQGPVLDSVGPISTNNYKVELLGDNFGSNPSVSVRENVNGSSPLEVFPSTVFHNQGTHTSTGKDFIRFPIVKVNQQSKFNNNGLCFKVISGSNESNEQCLVRTPTNPQPAFMGEFLQSYHHVNQNQDIDTDAYIVKADGSLFKIWGNSWKKIPFNYTVTPNTEIELQFRSTLNEGEISGVGFIVNGETNLTGGKFWQFHGTQSWGIQEHNDYSGTAYKTYTIKIGQKFTGQIKNIVFVGDDDGQRVGQNIVFKPIVFRESGTITIDEYDDVPAQRDFDDDASGKGVSWAAGDTQHLHNFHDSGDQDWTLVYGRNVSVTTQLMGANADTDLEVYHWLSATPDYNLGYYVNVVDEFVGEDVGVGASEFSIFSTTNKMYGIKASSHGNQFGLGTEYGLRIKAINPGTPDIYDASTYGDDIEGRATHWIGGDTVHYHNFDVQNDIDWTIVGVGGNFNFTAEANATGKYGGTKMTVYKWISYDVAGNGLVTNIIHQYVGQDSDGDDSMVNIHSTNAAVYAIKVESDRQAFGNNTGYSLRLH